MSPTRRSKTISTSSTSDLNALEQQFDALTAVAPLAWSDELQISAETHSEGMLDQDVQEHFLPGEPGLLDRIRAAGYDNISRAGENIFAFDQDPLFGFTAFFVDWGFDSEDIVNGQVRDDFANFGDGIQDPPGHRNAIMSENFQEFGVSGLIQTNPNANVGPVVTTQHFGARFDYKPQFLGVVFDDLKQQRVLRHRRGPGRRRYRHPGRWRHVPDGEFRERRLAVRGPGWRLHSHLLWPGPEWRSRQERRARRPERQDRRSGG